MNYTLILAIIAVVLSTIVLLQSVSKLLVRQREEKYLIALLKRHSDLINQIKEYEHKVELISEDSYRLHELRERLLKEIDAEVYKFSKKHKGKLNATHQIVKAATQKEKLRYSDKLLNIIEMDLVH